MKKYLITIVINFTLITTCFAGPISRCEISFGPTIGTVDNVYVGLLNGVYNVLINYYLENDDKYTDNYWFQAVVPLIENKYRVEQTIIDGDSRLKLHWLDWRFENISAGYHFGLMTRTYIPFGFDVKLSYELQTIRIKGESGDDRHQKQMLVPQLALRFGLLRCDATSPYIIIPFVEVGASYDWAFKYKGGGNNDINSINNGITGFVGFGLCNRGSHLRLSLRYYHSFYNYFNTHYSPDGASFPYADCKTKFGSLSIYTSFGL